MGFACLFSEGLANCLYCYKHTCQTLPSSPHEEHNFEMTWLLFLSSPPIPSSGSMPWSRIRFKMGNLPSPQPLRSESQFQKQMTSALDVHCSYLL